MKTTAQDFAHIPGWGIDADPKNDPTYPMRIRENEEEKGYSWDRPTLEVPDHEVLHSIERPDLTAVVGNSVPPSGLSGMIRRFAFKYSENIPNIFVEKGYKAEWKHDKKGLIAKLAGFALVTAGAVYLLSSNKSNSRKRRS